MNHIPVLLHETIKFLNPSPEKKYIDATLGMAGHARALIENGAQVLGIDQDPQVVEHMRKNFQFPSANWRTNFQIVQGNFADLKEIAEEKGFSEVDGILLDLGLGSHQLD